MQRGFRTPLSNFLDENNKFNVNMIIDGSSVYDFCCFGIDNQGKLSNEDYMIFYNQTNSPKNEIIYTETPEGVNFEIDLTNLPQTIDKLVFTASIDGEGTMGDINSHKTIISQDGKAPQELSLTGSDFTKEKAIISIEIYRKGVFRMSAVASGFNGGLSDLISLYGGESETTDDETHPPVQSNSEPIPPQAPTEPTRSQVQSDADLNSIISSKGIRASSCKIVVAADISGAMSGKYRMGAVSKIIDKIKTLSTSLGQSSLDLWYFAEKYKKVSSDLSHDEWKKLTLELGIFSNQTNIIKNLTEIYDNSAVPVLVFIIGNGRINDKITLAKYFSTLNNPNIFFQFIGLGDTTSAFVKNAKLSEFDLTPLNDENMELLEGYNYLDFLMLDSVTTISDSELFDKILTPFSAK